MRGGRTMEQYTEAFVGIDTAKKKHALAIADPGRDGETRYLGEIDSTPAVVQRMIRKLARRYEKLYFCYEAGPTGTGFTARCVLWVTTALWLCLRWCQSDRASGSRPTGAMP